MWVFVCSSHLARRICEYIGQAFAKQTTSVVMRTFLNAFAEFTTNTYLDMWLITKCVPVNLATPVSGGTHSSLITSNNQISISSSRFEIQSKRINAQHRRKCLLRYIMRRTHPSSDKLGIGIPECNGGGRTISKLRHNIKKHLIESKLWQSTVCPADMIMENEPTLHLTIGYDCANRLVGG